jgi:hypothetical protein
VICRKLGRLKRRSNHVKIQLPIAERELRVAAHYVRLYRVRAGMAAAGAAGMAWAFLAFQEMGQRSSYLLGQTVFFVSAWTVFVLVGGAFGATADCISSEKRAGTLGLLFLTRLKGRDVILGKLLAHGLRYFVAIGALFPILALPVLLGGVTFAQCFRLMVSVTNLMLFSLAAGLMASTFCLREQVAKSKALQIVLLFTAAFPLLARLLQQLGYDSAVCLALQLVSPVYAQRAALGAVVGPQLVWFVVSACIVFLLSCLMLVTAAWFVPRCWQQRAKATAFQVISERINRAFYRGIPARSTSGRFLLEVNPFHWLAIRDQSLRGMMFLTIGGTIVLMAILDQVLAEFWPRSGFTLLICAPLLLLVYSIVKVRSGTLAVRHIAGAKESGMLEAILASRVGVEEIVRAQFHALWNLLGWPLLVMAVVCVAGLVYSVPTIDRLDETLSISPNSAFRFRGALIVAISCFFLLLDSVALTWVGMLCAFKASSPAKATSWTGFLVVAVPHLVYLVLVVALVHCNVIAPFETFYPPVILWAILKLVNDILMIAYARWWLIRAARPCLAEPVEASRNEAFWPAWLMIRLPHNAK